MRLALLLALTLAVPAYAQPPERKAGEAKKVEEKKKARPRPRIGVKRNGDSGSNVGDDASGGGARTAEPARGGTPGTPSGSFTGRP